MSTREKKTTIFKVGYEYYIYIKASEELKLNVSHVLSRCGIFAPLVRDINNDTSIKLNIIPVAMYQRKRRLDGEGNIWTKLLDKIPNDPVILPSISNDKEACIYDMTKDEEEDS